MHLSERHITISEYLRREQTATNRHEYHDGEVLEMSGGTYAHSLITANIVGEMRNRLRGGPCRALESNMRVASRETNRYVYPDASAICDPPEFDPEDVNQTTILNPRVIFEVLSESTEAYDRGEKFSHYRRIPSLREYVLVAQNQALVETFLRQDDETWSLIAWEGLERTARIRSLEIEIPLSEIYAGVDFEADRPHADETEQPGPSQEP